MTNTTPLLQLSAPELRDRLASGALTAVELTKACIARIEAREDDVRAWAWFDASHALAEAERLDAAWQNGGPVGPLHGLPVGLKDVIDTKGIPTENGCPVDAGRVPDQDAALVTALKDAGAIVFGKTVTTELAFMHPNKTRNPHNPGHTPGGSSSGSAAAVADGMVPLAVGTQTGGSVIRPASFCGVTGFKPSFDAIPRQGVLMQSHSLDTLGVFARDLGGAALLADVLMEPGLGAEPPSDRPPVFGVVPLPGWEAADAGLVAELEALARALGAQAVKTDLPEIFNDVAAQRACINFAEMAHHFRRYIETGADLLGPETRDAIRTGMDLPAHEYLAALDCQSQLTAALEPLFEQFDAILCPAALGPAPEGLTSTGDSIFNGLWTMAGTPAVTLPLLTADNGLPMGVQLVGPKGQDSRVLAAARWLLELRGA